MATTSVPWVEKHRPETLDDIVGQDHVISSLKRILAPPQAADAAGASPAAAAAGAAVPAGATLQHMLLYGGPGTGKTSTVLALARHLFGPTLMRERVLELNASDERGIAVVRHRIKDFASVAVSSSAGVDPKYPCPAFKLVILDECDSMTRDAQTALRRTMEKYSKSTRFCLICNYVSRIIAPLASRCSKFRFNPLAESVVREKLREIAARESLAVTDNAVETLMQVSTGDLRRAVTMLQGARLLVDAGEPLTETEVARVAVIVPRSVPAALVNACCDSAGAKGFQAISDILEDVRTEGYPTRDVIAAFCETVVDDDRFDWLQTSHVALAAAKAEACVSDGADEILQLQQVLSVASRALKGEQQLL